MDAIFALPPNLPPHDKAPLRTVPHCVIAEWPEGTFLENLAVLDDGDIAVAVMTEARIDRVSLSGSRSTLIQLSEPPTGLSVIDGMLYAAVGEPGGGAAHLWRIDPRSGGAESWMPLEGVVFANGLTPFASGRLMLAESHLGQLCLIDLAAKRTSVWIEDEKLSRTEGIPFLPGANGVKRYGDTVTVSSNGRALLLRAAVRPDGSADTLEVIAERLRVDDLAFDMHGAAYLCTHIGHSLDWLSPSGERVSLGAAAQGLAGSTACAFGRHGAERRALYVTTTGGIVTPPGGVLQPAKLVRLEVGADGYPLSGLA
jgi:sugar lactone lactonase YvrE